MTTIDNHVPIYTEWYKLVQVKNVPIVIYSEILIIQIVLSEIYIFLRILSHCYSSKTQ